MKRARLLLLLLAGCSSKPTGPSPVTTFELALGDAQCVRQARFGVNGASEVAACQARSRMYQPAYTASQSVAAGHLSFDAGAAADGRTTLAQAGCSVDAQQAATSACLVFTPNVKVGNTCEQDGECIGGLCQRDIPLDGCRGKCVAYLAIGAACQPTADLCRSDGYCDPNASLCVPRPTVGGSCSDLVPCAPGEFCLTPLAPGVTPSPSVSPAPPTGASPSPSPLCEDMQGEGSPCVVSALDASSCTAGLYCRTAVSPAVCARIVADAQPCDSIDACPDGDDCVGLAMDMVSGAITVGVCQKFVDLGGVCNPALSENGCPYDMLCDATAHTCRPIAPLGSDCTANGSSGFCDAGLYCDGTTGACTAQVPFGAHCTPPPEDTSGDILGQDPCFDGTCVNGGCQLVCE